MSSYYTYITDTVNRLKALAPAPTPVPTILTNAVTVVSPKPTAVAPAPSGVAPYPTSPFIPTSAYLPPPPQYSSPPSGSGSAITQAQAGYSTIPSGSVREMSFSGGTDGEPIQATPQEQAENRARLLKVVAVAAAMWWAIGHYQKRR